MAKRLETAAEQNFIPKLAISQHAQDIVDAISKTEAQLQGAKTPQEKEFFQKRLMDFQNSLRGLIEKGEADIRYHDLGPLSPVYRSVGVDPEQMGVPVAERIPEPESELVGTFADKFDFGADRGKLINTIIFKTIDKMRRDGGGDFDTDSILNLIMQNQYVQRIVEDASENDPDREKAINEDLIRRIDATKKRLKIQQPEQDDARAEVAQYAEDILPQYAERARIEDLRKKYEEDLAKEPPRTPMPDFSKPREYRFGFSPVKQKENESRDQYEVRAFKTYQAKIREIQRQIGLLDEEGEPFSSRRQEAQFAIEEYENAIASLKEERAKRYESESGQTKRYEEQRKRIDQREENPPEQNEIARLYHQAERARKFFDDYKQLGSTIGLQLAEKKTEFQGAPFKVLDPNYGLLDIDFDALAEAPYRQTRRAGDDLAKAIRKLRPTYDFMVQKEDAVFEQQAQSPEDQKKRRQVRGLIRKAAEATISLMKAEKDDFLNPTAVTEKLMELFPNAAPYYIKYVNKNADNEKAQKEIERVVTRILVDVESLYSKEIEEGKQLQEDLTSDKPDDTNVEEGETSTSQEDIDSEMTKDVSQTSPNKLLDLKGVSLDLIESTDGMLEASSALEILAKNPKLKKVPEGQNAVIDFLRESPDFKKMSPAEKEDVVKNIQDGELLEQAAKMLKYDPMISGIVKREGKAIRNRIADLFPYTTEKNEASYIAWMQNATFSFLVNQINSNTASSYRSMRDGLSSGLQMRTAEPSTNEYILIKRYLFAAIKRARQEANKTISRMQRENITDFSDAMSRTDFETNEILEGQYEGLETDLGETDVIPGGSLEEETFGGISDLNEKEFAEKHVYPSLSDSEQMWAKFFFGLGGVPKSLTLSASGVKIPTRRNGDIALPTERDEEGNFDWSTKGGKADLQKWKQVEKVYNMLHESAPFAYPKAYPAEALAYMYEQLTNKMKKINDYLLGSSTTKDVDTPDVSDVPDQTDEAPSTSDPVVQQKSQKRPVKLDRSKIKATSNRIANIRRLAHVRRLA